MDTTNVENIKFEEAALDSVAFYKLDQLSDELEVSKEFAVSLNEENKRSIKLSVALSIISVGEKFLDVTYTGLFTAKGEIENSSSIENADTYVFLINKVLPEISKTVSAIMLKSYGKGLNVPDKITKEGLQL